MLTKIYIGGCPIWLESKITADFLKTVLGFLRELIFWTYILKGTFDYNW